MSPGQEAEPLAGLDRGAREDDPPDLALGERLHRERDREVRLARARRADPERDRRGADRVDVALLRDGLRGDLLAAVPPDDVVEDVADVRRLVERRDDGADRVRADRVTALDELDELVDDRAGLRDALLVAVEREPVPAQRDRAAEPLAQRVEHAVADACELRGDLVGNGEHVLHGLSVGRDPAPPGARLAWRRAAGSRLVLYDEGCRFCTAMAGALAARGRRRRGDRLAPRATRRSATSTTGDRYAAFHAVDGAGPTPLGRRRRAGRARGRARCRPAASRAAPAARDRARLSRARAHRGAVSQLFRVSRAPRLRAGRRRARARSRGARPAS